MHIPYKQREREIRERKLGTTKICEYLTMSANSSAYIGNALYKMLTLTTTVTNNTKSVYSLLAIEDSLPR